MRIKSIFLTVILLLLNGVMFACPTCEKNQPKITQGLTHGTGPDSNWDWVIVSVILLITLLTLFFSVKYLIRPGEKNNDHIKHLIIEQ